MAVELQNTITGSDATYTEQNNKVSLDTNISSGSIFIRGDYGTFIQDESCLGLVNVPKEHYEIHHGDHYNIRGFSAPTSSGGRISFGVTTANGSKWIHFLFQVEGTTQTEVRFWEGATLSGGTTVTSFNNNRNATNTSSMTIKLNPIISGSTPTSGLLLASHSKGFESTNPTAASNVAQVTREDEWVLKSGTTYLVELKSVGANNIIDYAATWYEHTDNVKNW